MSRALQILRDHATYQAEVDPDTTARPLWTQIASEVDAYLVGDEPASPGLHDQPLFTETSPDP